MTSWRKVNDKGGPKLHETDESSVEQIEIDKEVNKLRDEQKALVKQHKDLEMDKMPSGFDLKPLSRNEMNVMKNELKL